MGWAAAIPAALGLGASLFGVGKGKETEYTAQAPEYQQQFSEEFMNFLEGKIGQGATPYGGPTAAGAMNPFTQSALGLWGASPYGQFGEGMPTNQPIPQLMPFGGAPMPGGGGQMPQQGGMPPGGAPQMPVPQQGGMGQRAGIPFKR